MPRRRTRVTLLATEFAGELAQLHGCGKTFDPVECWNFDTDKQKWIKVMVIMVHGHCDARESRYDYAETVNRQHIGSRYLYPAKTHKKPYMKEFNDDFGVFHDWASDPK